MTPSDWRGVALGARDEHLHSASTATCFQEALTNPRRSHTRTSPSTCCAEAEIAVNYAPGRGQCFVRLDWPDLRGRKFVLRDLLGLDAARVEQLRRAGVV